MPRLSQIAVDVRPLRESRDFQLLCAGEVGAEELELAAERTEAAELG